MRDWRKLYSSIITSEKLASVSIDARWLWTLLMVAQDDEGKFPWTPAKVKGLIAGTPWTSEQAAALRTELAESGLCNDSASALLLEGGETLNGTPSNARRAFLYEIDSRAVMTQPELSQDSAVTQHRGEERRGEKEKTGADTRVRARPQPITEDFKDEMVLTFAEQLGGSEHVRDHIGNAMNHTAIRKAINKKLYLRRWLTNEVKWQEQRNGKSRTSARPNTDGWDEWPDGGADTTPSGSNL